jgi:transposase
MNQYVKVSHVALDHHRRFGQLTARDAGNRILFRERLEYDDREKLRQRLSRFPAGTPAILEATFGWGWMSDELKAAALDPHLSSSGKVAAWRKARGLPKSNRRDADLLSELWPEQPRWWEVALASPEVRDRRELLRCRMALVAMQGAEKNRIHATLHRHGVLHNFSDLFGVGGRKFLQTLVSEGSGLREIARITLREHLDLLVQIRRQLVRVTRLVRKLASRDEQAELWHSLPGVGWILAWTIHAEVGDPGRFKDDRHLASYSLLAPMSDDTGEEDESTPLGRHVGWCGRATLKWAFIEAARAAVRKDAKLREFYHRRTENGTRDCNRGYIAVGRKLCGIGLSCVKHKRPYTLTPPPRPGSKPANPCPSVADTVNAGVDASVETANVASSRKEKRSAKKRRQALVRNKRRNFRPGMGQPEDPVSVAACGVGTFCK